MDTHRGDEQEQVYEIQQWEGQDDAGIVDDPFVVHRSSCVAQHKP